MTDDKPDNEHPDIKQPENEEPRNHRKSWWIEGATVVSVVWIGACLWLFTTAKSSCAAEGIEHLSQRISCLAPNELGDFLAGAFAPLAFLWLFVAVLLQRDELAAQRQELRDNREVSKQQADEARKSANYLHEQAEILKKQRKSEEESQAQADLISLVKTLKKAYIQLNREFSVIDVIEKENQKDNKPWEENSYEYRIGYFGEMEEIDWLGNFIKSILLFQIRILEMAKSGSDLECDGIEKFGGIVSILSIIDETILCLPKSTYAEVTRAEAAGGTAIAEKFVSSVRAHCMVKS